MRSELVVTGHHNKYGDCDHDPVSTKLADWLAVEDLFLLGLGCDITGAILLATSVTLSLRDIHNVCAARLGWNPPLLVSRARDRLRGRTARLTLVLGFLVQAIGYLLLVSQEIRTPRGRRGFVGGLLVLGLGVVGGWAADRVVQAWRLKSSIVRLASFTYNSEQTALPAINKLANLGFVEWPALENESHEAYVARVFPGVEVGPPSHD